MHVFLTGATGFVGSYVLRHLLDEGHTVRCLVHSSPDALIRSGNDVEVVTGDVTAPLSLEGALDGCDAVVHLVGIIEEAPSKGVTFERIHVDGTQAVVGAALHAGVDRFIHMSANGARASDGTDYQTTKWRAEEIVRDAAFSHWTIFRPSLLFGAPDPGRPEFASRLLRDLIAPLPVWPVFGDGTYELQPVHVENVAAAFTQALLKDAANGQTYFAGGPAVLPYVEILDTIAHGAGVTVRPKAYVPMSLARLGVQTVGRLGILPISAAQFEMLVEGNTGDASAFQKAFDVEPIAFTPDALAYLRD